MSVNELIYSFYKKIEGICMKTNYPVQQMLTHIFSSQKPDNLWVRDQIPQYLKLIYTQIEMDMDHSEYFIECSYDLSDEDSELMTTEHFKKVSACIMSAFHNGLFDAELTNTESISDSTIDTIAKIIQKLSSTFVDRLVLYEACRSYDMLFQDATCSNAVTLYGGYCKIFDDICENNLFIKIIRGEERDDSILHSTIVRFMKDLDSIISLARMKEPSPEFRLKFFSSGLYIGGTETFYEDLSALLYFNNIIEMLSVISKTHKRFFFARFPAAVDCAVNDYNKIIHAAVMLSTKPDLNNSTMIKYIKCMSCANMCAVHNINEVFKNHLEILNRFGKLYKMIYEYTYDIYEEDYSSEEYFKSKDGSPVDTELIALADLVNFGECFKTDSYTTCLDSITKLNAGMYTKLESLGQINKGGKYE